jgi:hypothetical protein
MSNIPLTPADGQPITTVDELNDVLVQAAGKSSGNYEIDLAAGANIELTSELEAINLQPGVTLDIEGNGATLDGKNETTGVSDNQRGLFVYSGKVTIENLTIANTTATGGTGGGGAGGGAGLGGGLLVANDTANHAAPGDVTLSNVVFTNDTAVGGHGGQGNVQTIGGGGGLGGNGNNGGYYGGGGGIGSGIVPGVASGAGSGSTSAGGDGGGIGGTAGSYDVNGGFFNTYLGGLGGFGGGGGAGDAIGGDGGFGGGGGADTGEGSSSSQGGYGGGGGASSVLEGSAPGAGGFGGGSGGGSAYFYLGGGGGGLGAGGDIFVMDGALLTISQGSLTGGQAFKGVGGSAGGHVQDLPGTDGQAYGGGIFLQGNENINFAPAQGTTVTIADVIADEFGSGGGGVGYTGKGALTLNGAGTLELGAVNTFAGGVTIEAGTLEIGAGGSAGSGAITFSSASAKLQLDATLASGTSTVFADTLSHVGPGYELDLQGLAFVAGATATVVGTTLTVTSGTTSEIFTLDDPAQAFTVASDGLPGTSGTLVTAFALPTITGVIAGQLVAANGISSPFSGVTIGDLNSGATETLTITLSDPAAGALAEGAGFAGSATLLNTAPGIYSLSGTPTALTAELQALAFHAGNGTPGSFETTTFTLNDLSNLGYTASDSTTTVAVVASGNTVPGIGVGGTVDIGGLTYSAAVSTGFSSGGVLTVGNLSVNVSGVAGTVLLLGSDGHGGTLVTGYATLSDAITAVDGKTSGYYTIQLTSDSVETADPAAINLASGVGLTISGANGIGGYALDGGAVAGVGGHRGLFVAAGTVTIANLVIQNAAAIGATGGTGSDAQYGLNEGGSGGGGGGAGLGGGLYVASGASASLIDVGFAQDSATGGAGGQGGVGGQTDGNRAGGTGGQFPASDGFGSGGSGGSGLSVAYGGAATSGAGGGFGGGGGGGGGGDAGGGIYLPAGGSSSGGFGGGGGNGGVAAPGGGDGGMGGGGLGAGGDIFVQDGGTLTISGGSLVDGTVTAGTGANPGQSFGKGLFLQGTSTTTFTAAAGDTTTVAFTITDQNGSVQANVANESGNVAIGDVAGSLTGTVDLTGTDTYTGATTVNAGTLLVDGAIAGSAVEVKSGATLGGHGTTGAVTVDAGGTFSPGNSPGQITVASLTLASGSHFEEQIGGMTAGSGYDQTVVQSGGTISLNGATLDVTAYGGFVPTLGILTIIDNQDPTAAVTGVFDDAQGHALTQGSVITVAGVDFRINYHGGDGNDVTLSDLNVPPTLTATADDPTFTGNVLTGTQGAAVTVFSGADASAVDRGTSIVGLNLTVGGLHDGASETLTVDGTTIELGGASSGTTSGHDLSYSVSLANGTATIAFTSSGTSAAAIDTIIDGIGYQDTNAADPAPGDRTITLTQIQNSGGTGDGGVDTATISIASTVHVDVIGNQPPTLTATADNPGFIESTQLDTQVAPVTVFSGANASTVEPGQSIIGLNLAVAGLQDGADETIIVDGTTIELGGASSGTTSGHDLAYSVSLSSGTATISFSSSGTSAAVIDSIIDGIAYQNTNENDPTAGVRTITLTQIQDNGGTFDGGVDTTATSIASTVTVVPVNYAPSLTATATNSALDTAAPLQPIATPFSGADAGTVKPGESFSGFTFTVQGLLDGANETIAVDGTTIALGSDSNGTTAGNGLTYAVSLANGTATVTLSSSGVSTATIDGIIDGLTYADTLVNATAGDRTVTLTQIQESGGAADGGVDTAAVSIAATVDLTEINNAPTASANPGLVFVASEIPVNTATAGDQDDPQIAALKDGGYVVTWQDGDPYNYNGSGSLGVGGATGDSSGTAVKAQVFTASGEQVGSEILVNTTTAGNQSGPAIATLDDGDFVIAWNGGTAVDAQLFTAAGAKEGAQFQVNTSLSGGIPSVAALAGGGFAVVWSAGQQLEAQTFGADGTEIGSQVSVGSLYPVFFPPPPPAITALSGGGFAVTWIDLNANVETQAFSATGTPVGAATVLGADTYLIQPAIAALNNGGFVVTWGDPASNTIDAQIFSAAGAELGPLIHVDQAQIGSPPEIATLSDGDFVIAWTSVASNQYYSESYLEAQIFTPEGEAVGSPITVSSVVNSGFGTPEVTALPNGQFAVTYAGTYGSLSNVYSATGAFIGIDEVAGPGTVAALANNGLATAWTEFTNGNGSGDGSGNGIKAEVFNVAYQETAGTALNLKNDGLSVGDVDGMNGIETLKLSVTEGILNVAAGGSQATVAGSGSGLVTVNGTIAEINALLNTDNTSSISFTDASPNPAQQVTLTLTIDDNGNSGTGGAMTATAAATIEVAVPPVNTVPGLQLVPEGVATEIAGLSVADSRAQTVTTTLQVQNGTLTVGTVDGASVSGSGTQEVMVSGTVAQVDAVLSAANNVLYQGNFFGGDLLTMTSNDNGSSGNAGPLTATSHVSIAVGVPALLDVVASGTGITNGTGDVNANHVVTLTFEMSDVVYVSGGIPTLFLNDGESATYSGGSGTDALTFTYQVMSGDNTAALAVNGYNLGGASFLDASGHGADINLFDKFTGIVQIDTTAPTVSVAADHTALLAGQTSTVTFTFSEAVANFALADATVTGGSLGNLVHVGVNGSNQDIYTATFTPDAVNSEAGSVQLDASSYSDLAGNNGTASNTVNFSGDTLAPTVSVAADHTTLLAGQTAAVTFTFSEAATSFALGDTSVSGGSLSNLVHVGLNGSNQDIYTATFTPDATHTETGSVEVNVTSYTDLAGNTGASSNTLDFSGDTLAPTATAMAAPSTGIEGVGDIVKMTLSFGEAVTIGGATPELTLNDGGHAIYDAAATSALHDASKLVFDYTVGPTDATVASLAITGITAGTTITDLAGNNATVAASFAGLQVISSIVAANPDSNNVTGSQMLSTDAAHGVLANDTDTNPTDHLFVSAVDGLAGDVNQPIAGTYGTLTLHADGGYTYTANNMSVGVGVDNFVYTTSDGHGQDSTALLAITVTGTNETYTQVAAGGSATSGFGNAVLDGSAGNATLTAAPTLNAHPVLIGGLGDTLNAANFGQDTFVFNNNFGHDTVNNFQPALDVLQLQQTAWGSAANVMADIHQVGSDSVITLDADHVITLTNVQHASLTAADFHLV